MGKKVVVAMSGGVDSSVVAAILKKEGYECIGMHMRLWVDPKMPCGGGSQKTTCCSQNALVEARAVAQKLEIPFHAVDVGKEFKKRVVDYFLKTYGKGQTPNPCVACNRFVKFGSLMECARKLGADALATGHYAKIKKNRAGEFELFRARDAEKDQSYFLAYLTQKQLAHSIFPLGGMTKSEVYELAKKFGLKNFSRENKKESQDICFFPEDRPNEFLKRHLDAKFFAPGPILTVKGSRIGTHKGLPLYTIGQRHGLGIGGVAGEKEGESWYVVYIDRRKNTLVVGHMQDIERKNFECVDLSFISGKKVADKLKVRVGVRYRSAPVPATLEVKGRKGFVECSRFLRAVAPGQTAVFYDKDKVLGCGTISPGNIYIL